MSADLDHFESRLREHFERLADAKRPSGQPLFALEHCLDASGVEQMRGHLYASIRHLGMSDRYRHCWLVHAAEHGYTFEGLEFWQSFARLTPQWTYYGDRDTLRNWFAEFARRFNGARPVGRWAQHYKYIAWPITHALLPNDLQVQLAHTLYHLRYRLDELILLDYSSAGQMVARHVEWPSTRFKHFLEQHILVGRVVRALLEGTPEEPMIYLPTLQRITNDLNAKSQARAWLRDAQKYFDRFRAKLAAGNPGFPLSPPSHVPEEQQVLAETDSQGVLLRPRLQLRRTASTRWDTQLVIPSFQALANLKPGFRDHLARVRYCIPAHGTSLFLGQSLLSGNPVPKRLTIWPQERKPLLKFNEADTAFDRIVDAECQLLPAKLWVFHCLDDDSARHIQGQHVRARQTYVVVSMDATLLDGLGDTIGLNCAGVSAVRLEVPEIVGGELLVALKRAGIALHGRVVVEPVGLRPRQWSDDGIGEWLSTETPLLALTCEYDVRSYQIELNGASRFEIQRVTGTGPTLVALRDLTVGHHHVSISALSVQETSFGVQRRCVATAAIELYVRHPTTWSPRTQLPEAMVVDVVPSVPSLDDFLEQRLLLRAEGDEARTVTCDLVLTSSVSDEEFTYQILEHRLPVLREVWLSRLDDFLRQYDELRLTNVSQAAIVVQAEDLGEVRVPLHLEMEPLRWALTKNKSGTTLFLVDEGVTDEVSVTFYEFDHPLRGKSIDLEVAAQGIECASSAGLYVARAGALCIAIAVATQERARGLAALGVQVSRTELLNGNTIEQLLDQLKLWKSARASSYMAKLKQHSVCEAIEPQLLARVCGVAWVHLESDLDQDDSDDNWRKLESGVDRYPSFAISLSAEWRRHHSDEAFDWNGCFERLALRFKITSDLELVALAWNLASNATQANGAKAAEAVGGGDLGILVRGARLLILCRNKHRRTD